MCRPNHQIIFDLVTEFIAEFDEAYVSYASLVSMVFHFCIFIAVTAIAKMSLTLVATKNACVHLLFPFQVGGWPQGSKPPPRSPGVRAHHRAGATRMATRPSACPSI